MGSIYPIEYMLRGTMPEIAPICLCGGFVGRARQAVRHSSGVHFETSIDTMLNCRGSEIRLKRDCGDFYG